MQFYQELVKEMRELPWQELNSQGLQQLMVLSAFAATEFAESLRIALQQHPASSSFKRMASEELETENLQFGAYNTQGDHAAFLWHFVEKYRYKDLFPEVFHAGEEYLQQVRGLPDDIRAMSIVSRERELPAIFSRILLAKDWSAEGLAEFRYYLERHISLDSSQGGHAAMLAEFSVDERVAQFYGIRLALYRCLPFGAMDYYSEIAAGYDELHGAEQDEKLQEFLSRVALRPNITILDVGCGTGRSFAFFSEQHWHGIEPSVGLIAHAPAEARARMTQGAGEKLSWPEASFDVILSLTALQNYDDPKKGLDEMLRVAKPNAVVMISFIKKSPKADLLAGLIAEKFSVIESWEQTRDRMFLCRKER